MSNESPEDHQTQPPNKARTAPELNGWAHENSSSDSRHQANKAPVETAKPSALMHRIEAAQYDCVRDPIRGLTRLSNMFREGVFPREALNGPTNGQMIAANIAPLVTAPFVQLITKTKPWLGKTFDAANASGENRLTPGFVSLSRVLFPGYHGFRQANEHSFLGFSFRTYPGDGLQDPDRRVLKIDYDSPENPPAMRRVLDELVQIDDNYYLGKAHYRLSLTKWHLLFIFALQRAEPTNHVT